MEFTRPDFLIPFSVKDEGPSAAIFFHGGDSGFILVPVDDVVPSLTFLLLLGRSPFLSPSSLASPYSFCDFSSSLGEHSTENRISMFGLWSVVFPRFTWNCCNFLL